jgi:hypothetical protein
MTIKPVYKIPFTVGLFFTLSCLLPFIPIIIFTMNGGLIAYFNDIFFDGLESKATITNWLINFSLSILFLFLYVQAKGKMMQIIFSIIALLFIYSFIAILTMDSFGDIGDVAYLLYFILLAIISSLILYSFAFIKNRLSTSI